MDEVKPVWKSKFLVCSHDHYENQESVTLFPFPAKVKSTAETGLKCICVYIHPARNSSMSGSVQRAG